MVARSSLSGEASALAERADSLVGRRVLAYYGENGEPECEDLPGIACDVCGADCFAESFLFAEETSETDLCPKCFEADAKYAGAELQREGVAVKAAPKKRGGKAAKGGAKKAKK